MRPHAGHGVAKSPNFPPLSPALPFLRRSLAAEQPGIRQSNLGGLRLEHFCCTMDHPEPPTPQPRDLATSTLTGRFAPRRLVAAHVRAVKW